MTLRANRSACNRCQTMKAGCKPVLTSIGEVSEEIWGCMRCYRLDHSPCMVGEEEWLTWHSRQRKKQQVLEGYESTTSVSPVTSAQTTKSTKSLVSPLPEWTKMCQDIASNMARVMDPSTMHWLIVDYYFRRESLLDTICHRPTLQREWLARPLLTACVAITCFDRTGKLDDPTLGPMSPRVDPAVMESSVRLLLSQTVKLLLYLCKETPSMSPTIPFAVVLETLQALRIVQIRFARQMISEFFHFHLLLLEFISKWELYRLDELQCQDINGYLADLWLPDRKAFSTSLAPWRCIFRNILWAVRIDDFSYSGYCGGTPRLNVASLSRLLPLVPDTAMLIDTEAFESWYPVIPNQPLGMSWLLLERGDVVRNACIQNMCRNIPRDGANRLKCASLLISAGVLEATYKVEDADFLPLQHVNYPVKVSPLLLSNPLQFYHELIDDIIEAFPPDLFAAWKQGDGRTVINICTSWFGVQQTSRFVFAVGRLMHSRIRCQAWMPAMYIVDFIQDMNRQGIEDVLKLLEKEVKPWPLRSPSNWIQMENPKGKDWFKLLVGGDLQAILMEAILLTQLLEQITALLTYHSDIPIGQSFIVATIDVMLIHLAIVVELHRRSSTLLEASLADVRTHLTILKMQLARSTPYTDGLPPWMIQFEQKLTVLDSVDIGWVKKFYGLTMADINPA